MIIKSYEIQKTLSNFLKYNLFLLYGENDGLRKDIRGLIQNAIKKKDNNTELLFFYENDIIENDENFYNSVFSDSLFGSTKIITINNGTDKILQKIDDIIEKYPENVFLIIFADLLEKKSKLRNFFEKNTKTLCIPCYLDNNKDLEIIAKNEFKKNNITLSTESINLLIDKSNGNSGNLKNEI